MIKTALKGAAMGIAEVIPGVSGGTIAFITGIYERLIKALGNIPKALPFLLKGNFKDFGTTIDFFFLLKLGIGMVVGIGIGVVGVTKIMESNPIVLWAFFFGLIAASILYLARQVKWNLPAGIAILCGIAIGLVFTMTSALEGSDSYLYIFFCGVIAISALILPGISGSFLLLILGMYHRIIPEIKILAQSPNSKSLFTLLAFGCGAVIGIFSFAKLVGYAFDKWKNTTISLMVGLMAGSLPKIWPWQQVMQMRINSKGEEVVAFTKAVGPTTFSELSNNYTYGNDPQMGLVIGLFLIGFIGILAFDLWEKKQSKLA